MVEILHHGAVDGVTGSCHQIIFADKQSLLIDCGMFQGRDVSPYGADADDLFIDFDLSGVAGMVCTHVHNDHVARIPYLIAAGFDQPIYCSFPSAILLPEVLRESIKMSGVRDKRKVEALVDRIETLIKPLSYGTWMPVLTDVSIRLQPTGHILGASYVECRVLGEGGYVFSGDLGSADNKILQPPISPLSAHTVVLEATYGDRLHTDRATRGIKLQQCVERAVADLGAVLIPAFSLGRTQELLFELEQIIAQQLSSGRENSPWSDIAVIVDSPLAAKFNAIYKRLRPYWHGEARERFRSGARPFSFKHLITVDDHDTHLKVVRHLKETARPAIIISASGMLSGGRIMNYLKALLPDKRTDLLFVGYQAAGTLGRQLYEGAKQVSIDGETIKVNAQMHVLNGFSAHADQSDLVGFIEGMSDKPKEVRIVHGDDAAKRALKDAVRAVCPDANVWIP